MAWILNRSTIEILLKVDHPSGTHGSNDDTKASTNKNICIDLAEIQYAHLRYEIGPSVVLSQIVST